MPNYLANRWFSSLSEMSTFVVDSSDEDGLGPFMIGIDETNFRLATWRKTSAAVVDNVTIFLANGPGRWVVYDPREFFNPVIKSNITPSTVLPLGTTYIWTENGAEDSFDSVISYVSDGVSWIETNSRIRFAAFPPDDLSKLPNSESEQWKDTATGLLYIAFNGGWVLDASGGVS